MALLSSRQNAIGLDIGKSSIVGVQMAGKAPNAVFKGYHERPIPEGLVYEGEVIDPEGLADELRGFMKESGFKGKCVHLGVGNQKVIVRHVEMQDMPEDELRGAIEFQAQDYIPIPIEDAVLDFLPLGSVTDDEGASKQEVVLVAAQREMIDRYVHATKKAGVKVAGIDSSAFALTRALAPQRSFVDQGSEADHAFGIINVSSSVSTLVVARDSVPKFTRIVNVAFDSFIGALASRQGASVEDALVLAERIGLAGPRTPDVETYTAATIEDVQSALAPVAAELGEEIRRSLDYYTSQDYTTKVDHVTITGRGALLRNIDAFLSDFLNLEVTVGDPFKKVSFAHSNQPDEALTAVAPRLALAVGLALEEVD